MSHALTTSNGNLVEENENSISAGPRGPLLLQDFHLIDKLAHFDRERIPERVVHAKGAGAYGYLEISDNEISKYTCAKLFSHTGKRTPVFVRFSTVGGEKGSADTKRDPRGFAIKFYTEQGNWDLVGNNTPVFFIRDPIKFPDFIHTQKRNPRINIPDPDAFWDFLSLQPHSIHQTTILFSSRGTPDGFRHMNGFGSHTFKLTDGKGGIHYAKFHFKTDQGIKNLSSDKAVELEGLDADYATRDLYEAIENRKFPSWSMYFQVMSASDAEKYRWNIFDVTKVWPHADYPLKEIGKLVLNKNPENFFAETEQSAFSPSNMIPGIEPSEDKMLQGRLFSYPDTHRHRLGPNFVQIPVNRPMNTKVSHHQRDGFMTINGNFGSLPNYEPNSFPDGPKPTGQDNLTVTNFKTSGLCSRHRMPLADEDFSQAGALYRLQSSEEKENLVHNIAGHLKSAKKFIRDRQINNLKRADPEYGQRVEREILKLSPKY